MRSLLAALVFGLVASTSMATAQPDGDYRVPYTHREPRGWVRLATPTPTRFGTEYFVVGPQAGWFRMLRFDRTWGTVVLRQIKVVTRGRETRTFNVNIRLDRFHPGAYIDLGRPRLIDQLVVTTNRYPSGSYTIYGAAAPFRPEVSER